MGKFEGKIATNWPSEREKIKKGLKIDIEWLCPHAFNCVICWIVIYPMGNAIHLLNNQGLVYMYIIDTGYELVYWQFQSHFIIFLFPSVEQMTDTDDKKADEGQTEPVYGGCEGPNAMYVKLISSDDHEFIINRDYALTSGTIKAMLSGPGEVPDMI